MRSQFGIHGWARKRQSATDQGADNRVSSHGAGGVNAVAVREVVAGVDEDGRVARAEGDAGKDGPDPVPGNGHARPGEPELADGREDGGDADDADHGFGRNLAGFGVDFVGVDHAPDEGLGGDDGEGTDADADEGQARDARGPAADLGEDDGVGDEAEVEDAVDDGDVDVPEDAEVSLLCVMGNKGERRVFTI